MNTLKITFKKIIQTDMKNKIVIRSGEKNL